MSGQPRLFLVRHGETEWAASGRHTGWTDIPLNDRGRRQAKQLKERLDEETFALVVSSPLSRALETCRLVGLGDHAVIDPDLREWDYGAYEGLTTDQIRREIPGWTIWSDRVRDGEPIATVAARLDRVIARALEADGDVALFAHGHALRILAARWLGLEPAAGAMFELSTATISRLGWERERRVIELWNEAAHLEPE
ncbi:MAG TPA: histidine phosphatase family protein [Candidatus Limnocylindrales bacterium]|nr:histidine phosphatase family protein [Candidatus Limnocylindrales bacterium]